MKTKLTGLSIGSHLWVQWIMLGSILLDTFMVYPNIFHNIPHSFEVGMDFMEVASPHTYFPPLGLASIITGVFALLFGWGYKRARVWLFLSIVMIVLEGAISIIFEWPRNEIMFIEGAEVHSVEFLKQIAKEFLVVHWFRVAFNVLASLFIFVGFLKFYRGTLLKSNQS
ncbi:hypothetical protein [Halobacillus hunanensis]|uniref:hypothetical protein n=1 Tax=Halobacillus hunanensis TaxID=578214 RepID=UPI0009A7BB4F|nr:hypothetical protein [Halobacillus hunanensis]